MRAAMALLIVGALSVRAAVGDQSPPGSQAPGANADRVRDSLLRFVDHDLSPQDLIVVMKPLDSLLAIRTTRDRAVSRAAIESFGGRRGDYEPRNAYERDYIAGTPARIDAARN